MHGCAPLLGGLTDAQIEAVNAAPGPMLVLAGPGSGGNHDLQPGRLFSWVEDPVPAGERGAVQGHFQVGGSRGVAEIANPGSNLRGFPGSGGNRGGFKVDDGEIGP